MLVNLEKTPNLRIVEIDTSLGHHGQPLIYIDSGRFVSQPSPLNKDTVETMTFFKPPCCPASPEQAWSKMKFR
jgi:hypothetical protein